MANKYRIYAFFIIFWLACLLLPGVIAPLIAQAEDLPPAVKVVRLAGVAPGQAAEVKQLAEDARLFFAYKGFRLKSVVTIYLACDQNAYVAEVASVFGLNKAQAVRATQGTGGLAGGNAIVLNMSEAPGAWEKAFTVAHEMTHVYQYQIAGGRAGAAKWMVEGMADAVGAQFITRKGYTTLADCRSNWQAELKMRKSKPALYNLRSSNGWSNSISQYGSRMTYRISGFAALVLTQRYGQQRVLDYFVRLRQGQNADAAFVNTFRVRMADFENEIARLVY